MRTIFAIVLLFSVSFAQDFKQENTPENLKEYFSKMRSANVKSAAAMSRSLFCNEARLKLAVKEGTDAAFISKVAAWHKEFMDAPDDKVAPTYQGKPEQTVIQVHASSVEALAKYAEGTPAYNEFPGGARTLASSVLKPGLTFYEVELLEPGKESGMKYHLFFWDGKKWASLGPAWRHLPKN